MMDSPQITKDLMAKIADDVSRAMMRTVKLASERQYLPITMAGGSAAIGIIAAVLDKEAGRDVRSPDRDCILLAALLCAHCAINRDEGIAAAYRDLAILRGAATDE